MIVIIIIASCRKEFSKTGGSTIIKNVVYQNHFIKSKGKVSNYMLPVGYYVSQLKTSILQIIKFKIQAKFCLFYLL